MHALGERDHIGLGNAERRKRLRLMRRIVPHSVDIFRLGFAGQRQHILPRGLDGLIGRPLVHVVGMRADGNKAGAQHFCDLVLPEVGRQAVLRILVIAVMPDRAANGKDRRMEAKLPQNGIGIDCVAGIAVVKRDHDRLFRKRRSLLHKRDQLIK